jgi:hypothetical protein
MGMSRTVLLVASVAIAMHLVTLYGCSQASSPVEKREKKEGVEEVAKEDKKTNGQKKEKEKVAPGYTPKEQAKADAAKAAAAEHEMTLADLKKMNDETAIMLGNCQTGKLQRMYGPEGAKKYADDYVDMVVNAKRDFPSFQEYALKDGVSCTWQEMISYDASLRAASSSASAP